MKITIEKNDLGCVVLIDGRLDTITSNEFQKLIEPAVAIADRQIVLDCANLSYISSSGLRQLLMIKKQSTSKGGSVIIKNLRDDIKQTLVITGFDALFEIQ